MPAPPRPLRLLSSLSALAVPAALGAALACSGNELTLPTSAARTALGFTRVSALPTITSPAPAVPIPRAPASELAVPPPASEAAAAPSDARGPAPEVVQPAPEAEASPLELLATARETIVYAEPSRRGQKVGYLRLGARVRRSRSVAGYDGCAQGWYPISPYGFVCSGNAASKDVAQPLAELARTRPDREAPLPYAYGRSKPVPPPLYTHLPQKAELLALEGLAPRSAAGFLDLPLREVPELLADGRPLPVPFGYARADATSTARALPNSGFALLDVLEHQGRSFGLQSS